MPHTLEHHDGKAATCTEAGHSEYDTCECGYTTCQVIPALGHDFAQYTSDGNATHLADGTKTATCSRCTVTDTQPDAGSRIAEHAYDQKVVDAQYLKSAATCTDAGSTTRAAHAERREARSSGSKELSDMLSIQNITSV